LDQGLVPDAEFADTWADSLSLYQDPTTGAQELAVGGHFGQAGSLPSLRAARWIVGSNHCANAYLPTVYFNQPLSSATISPNSPITLVATAIAPTGSQISNVLFYADITNSIGSGTPGANNTYSQVWTPGFSGGVHRFDAVATCYRFNWRHISCGTGIIAGYGSLPDWRPLLRPNCRAGVIAL
jgi:hypothetical protein